MKTKRKKKTAAQKAAAARKAKASLARDNISRRTLGNIVRGVAKFHGLSRDDMAVIVKDAASQMSRLMQGHDEEFSADRLVGYLRRLDCPVSVIVGRPNRPLPNGRRVGRQAGMWTRVVRG